MHQQGASEGDSNTLGEANLMSAEAYTKQKVAATTKGLSTSHGGKGATSEKSPADTKDSPTEALQDKEKDNGQILEDPRTKEYAEHCVGGHTKYNHRCPVCIKGHMRAEPATAKPTVDMRIRGYEQLLETAVSGY